MKNTMLAQILDQGARARCENFDNFFFLCYNFFKFKINKCIVHVKVIIVFHQ